MVKSKCNNDDDVSADNDEQKALSASGKNAKFISHDDK